MEKGFVIIKQKTLQKLLDNFYEMCSTADELNIYEREGLDDDMQEMKEWADNKFGRTINKENYK
jgi:hypothetical protein